MLVAVCTYTGSQKQSHLLFKALHGQFLFASKMLGVFWQVSSSYTLCESSTYILHLDPKGNTYIFAKLSHIVPYKPINWTQYI